MSCTYTPFVDCSKKYAITPFDTNRRLVLHIQICWYLFGGIFYRPGYTRSVGDILSLLNNFTQGDFSLSVTKTFVNITAINVLS